MTEIYLDVETQYLSSEVEGGWSNIRAFKLAVAVTWSEAEKFREWYEGDAAASIAELGRFDRVVTFNGIRFDLEVLSAYGNVQLLRDKSLDILKDLERRLGFRPKLQDVARATLGNDKTGSGQERNQFQLIVDTAEGPEGLYIVDRLNTYIKIYSVDGRFLYGFPRREVGNPAAIAVDEHQRVYVADAFDDTIKVYIKEKYAGEIGGTGSTQGRFRFITDIYIDQNFLYVADSMNQRVQVFVIDPHGAPKEEDGVVVPPPLPEQAPVTEGAIAP